MLRRWTAWHAEWEANVGSLAVETSDGLVFIDPLDPPADLGAGAKPRATAEPLRLCPERWLGAKSHDDLKTSLRPLLDLPVEQVLVSHGVPVLEGGREALAAGLA